MKTLAVLLFTFLSFTINAQDSEIWFAFQNKDSSLIGFKNQEGTVKIPPRFMGMTIARKMKHIMGAMELDGDTYKNYYLTKYGKKVGKDSMYVVDNSFDCESEGFIRFADPKTKRIGMFDKNGAIAIPAKYNHLSRVNNGLIVALKGAKKEYWDKHNKSGCNHFSWTGGTNYLLNTHNEILVENFDYDGYLDLFSVDINPEPTNDETKIEFQGKNGQYYAFTDHKQAFVQQLKRFLPYDFIKEELAKVCYDTIYYPSDQQGWGSEAKKPFLDRNFELMKRKILHLMDNVADYNIFVNGLNPYIYQGDGFAKYFNNCGEAKEMQYPVMNLVINTKNDTGEPVQDHFYFLKTDQGFKLIAVSIRSEKLK